MSNVTVRKAISQTAEKTYRETLFTKSECESLLRMFMELNKNVHHGRMDRNSFRDLMNITFRMTDDILLDRVFRAFDKDNDGYLGQEEWLKGLSIVLRGNLAQKTRFSFDVYDLNSDGAISREEMFQLLKESLLKQPADEDPDEGIRDLVEITFKKLDMDHDGKLSFEDFEKAVQDEPLLLEGLGPCFPDEDAAGAFLSTFQEIQVSCGISYIKTRKHRIANAQ